MNYSIRWTVEVLDHLTLIWLNSGSRSLVAAAQHTIDGLLGDDPFRHGKHESEGLHSIEVFPLRALFEVDDSARVVWIVSLNWMP